MIIKVKIKRITGPKFLTLLSESVSSKDSTCMDGRYEKTHCFYHNPDHIGT